MSESKTPTKTISKVLINFGDAAFNIGLRGDYRSQVIHIDVKTPEELKARLVKKNGVIVNVCYPFQTPTPNTGSLSWREPDHYNGKDIRMTINAMYKGTQKAETKLGREFHWQGRGEPSFQLSDLTEYMTLKTYFEGDVSPHVSVHHIPANKAIHKDPTYGSCYFELNGNPYWSRVEMTIPVPDSSYENSCQGSNLDFLVLRSDANVKISDEIYENVPSFGGGGGDTRKKYCMTELIEKLPGILKVDEQLRMLRNRKTTDPSQADLEKLATRVLS